MQNRKLNIILAGMILPSLGLVPGCKNAEEYRKEADEKAYSLIHKAEKDLFNRESVFTIETAEDQLRRRLMEAQGLPYSGKASLGIENLDKPDFWPEKDFPAPLTLQNQERYKEPIKVSLLEALQMAAAHNFEYQSKKESVFATALGLDLQGHGFESTFSAGGSTDLTVKTDPNDPTTTNLTNSGDIGMSRQMKNGTRFSANIFLGLAQILTPDKAVGRGTSADASVSIPLLRGSGEHIVTEKLTQSQRDLVYAVYDFEHYKKTFAVGLASSYYGVLKRNNQIANAKANYESVKISAARSRKLAEAGRMTNIQRDQAIQEELNARKSWLNAQESYKSDLDAFKNKLGLPTDAYIELDMTELDKIVVHTENALNIDLTPSRETKIEFSDAPGPFELDENTAIEIALKSRFDINNEHGKVYDKQRAVTVAADRLRAELTLLGKVNYGGKASADGSDNGIDVDQANYTTLLTLDLPIERTEERNNYRSSIILLQQAVRSLQTLEDKIKLEIRDDLRTLKDRRNSLQIQAESVRLAEDRVRSASMFLEAGRIEMRDLLDAEKSLLSARNDITASVISYRLAELEIQRDLEKLNIDQNGLWLEYDPAKDATASGSTETSENKKNNS